MRRLPILDDSFLDDIAIASPCSADWARMKGDHRVRHCPDCRLNVYDLSAMTRSEAANLVRRHEGRLCVRLYRRADGTLVTAPDCRAYLRAARTRGMRAFVAALILVGLFQLGVRVFGVMLFADLFARPPTSPAIGAPPPQGIPTTPMLPMLGAPPPLPVLGQTAWRGLGTMSAVPAPKTPHPGRRMGGSRARPLKMGKLTAPAARANEDDPLHGLDLDL